MLVTSSVRNSQSRSIGILTLHNIGCLRKMKSQSRVEENDFEEMSARFNSTPS